MSDVEFDVATNDDQVTALVRGNGYAALVTLDRTELTRKRIHEVTAEVRDELFELANRGYAREPECVHISARLRMSTVTPVGAPGDVYSYSDESLTRVDRTPGDFPQFGGSF